jgi:hypothetical protein
VAPDEALALAHNLVRIDRDNVNGGHIRHNQLNGNTTAIKAEKEVIPTIQEKLASMDFETPEGIKSMEELAQAAGFWPNVVNFWSKTAGQLGEGNLADTEKAALESQFQMTVNRIVAASVNNPRGPVFELERAAKVLPTTGIIESPATALASIKQAKIGLETQYNFNAALLNSGDLTPQLERELIAANAENALAYAFLPTQDQLDAIDRVSGPNTQTIPPRPAAAAEQAQPAQAATPAAPVPVETLKKQADAMGLSWATIQGQAQELGYTEQEVLDYTISNQQGAR